MPPSLKRTAAAMEPEEDGPEKARSRILSFMAPQNNTSHMPRLDRKLNEFVPSSNTLCALVIVFWMLLVPFGSKVEKLRQGRHLRQAIST
jgi:hypothetical protein